MTDYECKICHKIITTDLSFAELNKHLLLHSKEELIPYVSWWMINR